MLQAAEAERLARLLEGAAPTSADIELARLVELARRVRRLSPVRPGARFRRRLRDRLLAELRRPRT